MKNNPARALFSRREISARKSKPPILSQITDIKNLPQDIFNAIKSVYEDLSRNDLLIRCLGGYI